MLAATFSEIKNRQADKKIAKTIFKVKRFDALTQSVKFLFTNSRSEAMSFFKETLNFKPYDASKYDFIEGPMQFNAEQF